MSLGKLLGLVALTLSLYILWQARHLLLLVFAALVLAIALNRPVQRLQRSGLKRVCAVFLSMSLFLLATVGFFWLILPPFIDQFQDLLRLFPIGLIRINNWLLWIGSRLPEWMTQPLPDLNNLIQQLPGLFNQFMAQFVAFFSTSLTFLVRLVLVLVLTMMFLAEPRSYRRAFLQLFPAFYRRRADAILNDCEADLGGWIVNIVFTMTAIALLSWLGLALLQVPLSLAHGVLAGGLAFIPHIGLALSLLPPVAIALIDSPWKALAVPVLYLAIHQFERHMLRPWLLSPRVVLLPAITLLVQVLFFSLFGVLGLVVAVPVAVVGRVWLREVVIRDVLDSWRSHPAPLQLPQRNNGQSSRPVATSTPGDRQHPSTPTSHAPTSPTSAPPTQE